MKKNLIFFLCLLFTRNLLAGIIPLSEGWLIKEKIVQEDGEKISTAQITSQNWLEGTVPNIVQTILMENKKLPDLYFGDNIKQAEFVAKKEWWYWKEFNLSPELSARKIWLNLKGINYKANIWLNGKFIGEIVGMFNEEKFEITKIVNFSEKNYLAIQIIPPENREKGDHCVCSQMTYGWDFAPRLIPVGIWKEVYLEDSGATIIENPYVKTELSEGNKKATLKISFTLINCSAENQKVLLQGKIEGTDLNFSDEVEISAQTKKDFFYNLEIENPKLWWPQGLGEPNLYCLNLDIFSKDKISDNKKVNFGIREIKILPNEGKNSKYQWTFCVNGEKIFAKGANWVPLDSLFRLSPEKYEERLKLFKEAGLNMLRVWGGGIPETEYFYNLCDEYGIMVWQDFSLAIFYITFPEIKREVFFENAKDTILRLRNHPSLVFWCGGNEFDPDIEGNKDLIDGLDNLIKKYDSTRSFLRTSPYAGDDHNWDVWHGYRFYPAYRKREIAFQSEYGLQAPPTIANLKKFIPENQLWPPSEMWEFHHLEYDKMERYVNEYGGAKTLEDYVRKAQLSQAVTDKYNLEFCRSKKYEISGCLVWQYNEPWPGINWSIVDYYNQPKPAYYFYKRAAEPLHILASYNDCFFEPGSNFSSEIYLINDLRENFNNLKVSINIYDRQMKEKYNYTEEIEIEADKAKKIFDLEWNIPDELENDIFFLYLKCENEKGEVVSSNLYWFGVGYYWFEDTGAPDYWQGITYTPQIEIYQKLNQLPLIEINASAQIEEIEDNFITFVDLENPSDNLGFFIEIEQKNLPAQIYSDNYFSLLPGEKKQIRIISKKTAQEIQPELIIQGWNINPQVFSP